MAEQQNPPDDKPLHCSFCGKSQRKVRRLIEGNVGGHFAFMCDECVTNSFRIMQKELENDAPAGTGSNDLPSPAQLKAHLDNYVIGQEKAKRTEGSNMVRCNCS